MTNFSVSSKLFEMSKAAFKIEIEGFYFILPSRSLHIIIYLHSLFYRNGIILESINFIFGTYERQNSTKTLPVKYLELK